MAHRTAFLFSGQLLAMILFCCAMEAFAQNRGFEVVAGPIAGDTATIGRQITVFIAVDRYREWLPLNKPVSDSRSLEMEHGRFFYGLPTPIFAGFAFQEGEAVKLGSMLGIASSLPKAKAYYLEFTGARFSALESAAKQKAQRMPQPGGSAVMTKVLKLMLR